MKTKWIEWIGLLALVIIISCICPMPKVEDDKIQSNPDGSTKFERTTPGQAKDGINRALDSKGFKRYKANVSQAAAEHWIDLSYYSGIATAFFLLAWYFFKQRELGGAAILCVLFSLFAVMMAELVGLMLWLMLGLVAVIAVGIGIALRNKSALEWAKKKWSKDQRSEQ